MPLGKLSKGQIAKGFEVGVNPKMNFYTLNFKSGLAVLCKLVMYRMILLCAILIVRKGVSATSSWSLSILPTPASFLETARAPFLQSVPLSFSLLHSAL